MSTMNTFAPFPKINGCFIVQSQLPPPCNYKDRQRSKTIFIFNYPIPAGMERDLLMIPGVSESDIRASLLKGELRHKLQAQEIKIVCSDIDLLQFNEAHKQFLKNGGIGVGLEVGAAQLDPALDLSQVADPYKYYQDVYLIGDVNNVNTVFTIPEGKFYYDQDHKILTYKNGIKQNFMDDFYIAESGGPGSGYDRIIFADPPDSDILPVDVMTADYYVYQG